MTSPIDSSGAPIGRHSVSARARTELVDALPHLLGYVPENSIVLLAVHGEQGRVGRYVRVGIPATEQDWPAAAEQIAASLLDRFQDPSVPPIAPHAGGDTRVKEMRAASRRAHPAGKARRDTKEGATAPVADVVSAGCAATSGPSVPCKETNTGGRARSGSGRDSANSKGPHAADGVLDPTGRPDRVLVLLYQEPDPTVPAQRSPSPSRPSRGPAGSSPGREPMEYLRPLAQALRVACGRLDVPVFEALCVSAGRHWSYLCPEGVCCPPEGEPLAPVGTSVLAAASVYAGRPAPRGIGAIERRLRPWETAAARDQEQALDAAVPALLPRLVGSADEKAEVRSLTLGLADLLIARFHAAPPAEGLLESDLRDDELLAHDEAAALVLGLQDRVTRDCAAAWMEGPSAPAALRLWRALARRCVGAYSEHAAAALTLAGWVAWSLGDVSEGRVAFHLALAVDPRYLFAALLDEACDQGVDVEAIRGYLRRAHSEVTVAMSADGLGVAADPAARPAFTHDVAPEGKAAPLGARGRVRAGATGTARGARRTASTRPPGTPATARRPDGRRPSGGGRDTSGVPGVRGGNRGRGTGQASGAGGRAAGGAGSRGSRSVRRGVVDCDAAAAGLAGAATSETPDATASPVHSVERGPQPGRTVRNGPDAFGDGQGPLETADAREEDSPRPPGQRPAPQTSAAEAECVGGRRQAEQTRAPSPRAAAPTRSAERGGHSRTDEEARAVKNPSSEEREQ
ncbi:DUF4192 family protein [Streptomyces sp. NPDC049954]|uniref:DUF4192 domain-containing protein n=1 Tax=Streptomyces sp. NPDC049954 TaxID=3155779 RepID=UPI003421DE95